LSYLACAEILKKIYLGCLGLCFRNQFNGMILLVVVWKGIEVLFSKHQFELLNMWENGKSIVFNLVIIKGF